MSDAVGYILRGAHSAVACYGALYIVSATFWPSWFIDTLAVNHVRGRFDRSYRRKHSNHNSGYGRPWHEVPLALFTLFAIGVLLYSAAYAIVAVVPYSWGGENEDGDWQGTHQYLQYLIAALGTIALVGRIESNAEILAWAASERKARIALTEAIRFARHLSPEANRNIVKSVDQKLEPEAGPEGFSHRYATDLRRWIAGDIVRP